MSGSEHVNAEDLGRIAVDGVRVPITIGRPPGCKECAGGMSGRLAGRVEYARGDDTTNPPTKGWSETCPDEGRIVWVRLTILNQWGNRIATYKPHCIAGLKPPASKRDDRLVPVSDHGAVHDRHVAPVECCGPSNGEFLLQVRNGHEQSVELSLHGIVSRVAGRGLVVDLLEPLPRGVCQRLVCCTDAGPVCADFLHDSSPSLGAGCGDPQPSEGETPAERPFNTRLSLEPEDLWCGPAEGKNHDGTPVRVRVDVAHISAFMKAFQSVLDRLDALEDKDGDD